MAVGPTLGFGRTVAGTLSPVNDIFKEFYLPGVRDILNSKRILTTYVRRNTEDVAGKEAVTALNIGRNVSPQHVAERGKLPDPGTQEYDRAIYNTMYYYGRILFTGPSSASSRNNRGAFLRAMDAEIRGLARDAQHNVNKDFFGDGSGRLARLTNVTGAPVYNLKDPGGFVNVGLGTQYIQKGDRVGLVNPAGAWADALFRSTGAGAFTQEVTAVDYTNGTMTVAAEWTADAANDLVVKCSEITSSATDIRLNTDYLHVPYGLAALVSDADPHSRTSGPNRQVGKIASSVNEWQSYIIDANGTPQPFSSDMLQQAMDGVDQIGDGQVQIWITTHGIRRQYLNELVANKRYVNTMELDGGFRALEYDGIPFVVDKDCTRGRLYGLDLDCLHMYMETDYEWMDADGSILHRLEDYDMYQATLYRYHQFGTDARNRLAGIFDIADV